MNELSYLINTLVPDAVSRIYLAYSGGLDSTALLFAAHKEPRLQNKLTAIHINHGLSLKADQWQIHCEQQCNAWKIPLITKTIKGLDTTHNNLEEKARAERYHLFHQLLSPNDYLLLGHHRRDQAETVLMRLLRGCGVEGLSAMSINSHYQQINLLRPWLNVSHKKIVSFAKNNKLQWIQDDSNDNLRFARNHIRHQVLPFLAQRYPSVESQLVTTAQCCKEQSELIERLLKHYMPPEAEPEKLNLAPLIHEPLNLQKAVIRCWLKNLSIQPPNFKQLSNFVVDLFNAADDKHPQLNWGEHQVIRYQSHLYYLNKLHSPVINNNEIRWADHTQPLVVDSMQLSLRLLPQDQNGIHVPPHSKLSIRFRTGGETIVLNGQTKKLKKLMQQWNIPPWQRDMLPLLYINGQLAAIDKYAISDLFKTSEKLSYSLVTLDLE